MLALEESFKDKHILFSVFDNKVTACFNQVPLFATCNAFDATCKFGVGFLVFCIVLIKLTIFSFCLVYS